LLGIPHLSGRTIDVAGNGPDALPFPISLPRFGTRLLMRVLEIAVYLMATIAGINFLVLGYGLSGKKREPDRLMKIIGFCLLIFGVISLMQCL
jgi:hypothetical protein